MDVLVATDFFTTEVWTLGGLVTCYVLFFIHLGSRKIHVGGMTPHPHAPWMRQIARNVTVAHFHRERTHQGKGNVLLFPTVNQDQEREGAIRCRERLGGLLKCYVCEVA
jgi:hypothetical protein